MSKRLDSLRNRRAAIVTELRAISDRLAAEDRMDLTPEEESRSKELNDQLPPLDASIGTEERLVEREREMAIAAPGVVHSRDSGTPAERPEERIRIVARPRYGTLRAFKGENAEERAYQSGQFMLAAICRNESAMRYCREHGIEFRAASEGVNSAGGYLVPDVMLNTIIDLRETYGVFRRNAQRVPMSSDAVRIPIRSAGLTAYYVNENTAPTQSQMTFGQAQLVAKKLAILSLWPTELGEDAVISLADTLAGEIGYQFALAEDNAGFIGTGTSTYGGIVGAAAKVNDGNHAGSIFTAASGNTAFSTLDLADFHGVTGKLPDYARPRARWYISRAGFADSMERLAYAGGGNTVDSISGGSGLQFLGYPVEISQVMNSTTAADVSAIKLLFGDLSMAAVLGDRRGVTVMTSEHRYFDSDQMAIRGTERFDINIHSLGDGSTAGPVVALKTPAS